MYDKPPLMIAIEKKHVDVTNLLLEQGVKVDAEGGNRDYMFYAAACVGQFKVVEELLNRRSELPLLSHLFRASCLGRDDFQRCFFLRPRCNGHIRCHSSEFDCGLSTSKGSSTEALGELNADL